MNIIEALNQAFGTSAKRLDLSAIGGRENALSLASIVQVHPVELLLTKDSRPVVTCGGGNVIARMRPVDPASRVQFYIVHDDSQAETWRAERRRMDALKAAGRGGELDWSAYHTTCPAARIRVVASA